MENIIVVRGGGDIATGTIYHLHKCGFKVLCLECEKPTAIRRKAAFCQAVFDGVTNVEDVLCKKIETVEEIYSMWEKGVIPLIVDENCQILEHIKPVALVDGILAKRNLGTNKKMAPVTVALGPGFTAGKDVDAVIETMRGHNLGRVIYEGEAIKNTGIPGNIGGYTKERVIHSPETGVIKNIREIGDIVEKGEVIAYVGEEKILATITGVLRGIINDGFYVEKGLKIADIDPRKEEGKNSVTISDKARCIAGGALEAILVCAAKKGMRII